MWELYQRCKAFGLQPSAEIGIHDNRWLAWQFDGAVWLFGSWVDGMMAESKDGKPVHSLAGLLNLKPAPRKLNKATLMNRVGSKVRVVGKKM